MSLSTNRSTYVYIAYSLYEPINKRSNKLSTKI